ncbi:MAG TPA: hypothetical protein VN203_10835, partial [Candidatus Acidoferrum sp.]|nr:hypothetical protein [Candidatus Acidoferrum sp.]
MGDKITLFVPTFAKGSELRLEVGFLFGYLREPVSVVGADGGLALQDTLLHFQIIDLADGIFNGRRSGVLAQR